MKFTREDALKIQFHHFSVWTKDKQIATSDMAKCIAIDVYDACQKAFEEERKPAILVNTRLQNQIETYEFTNKHLSEELKRTKDLLHATEATNRSLEEQRVHQAKDKLKAREEAERNKQAVLQVVRQRDKIAEELKIANGIVAQRREEISRLKEESCKLRYEAGIAKGVSQDQQRQIAQQQEQIAEMDTRIRTFEEVNTHLRKELSGIKHTSFPPPGAPDPGEGYRLLDTRPGGDVKQTGDECRGKSYNKWFPVLMEKEGFDYNYWYRRKIEPASVEPVKCRCGYEGAICWNEKGDGMYQIWCQTCGRRGDRNLSEDRAIAAWNALQSQDVQSCEPDPLEALLREIKNDLVNPSAEVRAIIIFIERELARSQSPGTRKEHAE